MGVFEAVSPWIPHTPRTRLSAWLLLPCSTAAPGSGTPQAPSSHVLLIVPRIHICHLVPEGLSWATALLGSETAVFGSQKQ